MQWSLKWNLTNCILRCPPILKSEKFLMYSHFSDEEVEAQIGKVICPKPCTCECPQTSTEAVWGHKSHLGSHPSRTSVFFVKWREHHPSWRIVRNRNSVGKEPSTVPAWDRVDTNYWRLCLDLCLPPGSPFRLSLLPQHLLFPAEQLPRAGFWRQPSSASCTLPVPIAYPLIGHMSVAVPVLMPAKHRWIQLHLCP